MVTEQELASAHMKTKDLLVQVAQQGLRKECKSPVISPQSEHQWTTARAPDAPPVTLPKQLVIY